VWGRHNLTRYDIWPESGKISSTHVCPAWNPWQIWSLYHHSFLRLICIHSVRTLPNSDFTYNFQTVPFANLSSPRHPNTWWGVWTPKWYSKHLVSRYLDVLEPQKPSFQPQQKQGCNHSNHIEHVWQIRTFRDLRNLPRFFEVPAIMALKWAELGLHLEYPSREKKTIPHRWTRKTINLKTVGM